MDQSLQEILDNSDQILFRIKEELQNASSEILLAMAWFTNQELYDIINQKAEQGVKIQIILADNEDNSKLDFERLRLKGVTVEKVKNVGYGMMHQKFCVIDRKIAITGSYNWSYNAKNNHESVVITMLQGTVNQLVDTFYKILKRTEKLNAGATIEEIEKEEQMLIKDNPGKEITSAKQVSFQEAALQNFKEVLDSIIATEVGAVDKTLLKDQGYQRAAENKGDHQVISQSLDSLYSNFINEIEIIDEKKIRLNNKINEQEAASISNVELKTQNEVRVIEENSVHELAQLKDIELGTTKKIEENRSKINANLEIKIPYIQQKIRDLKDDINRLQIDFVKPPINKPLIVLLSILGLMVLSYLFVFYSSVAYIFIFSKEDTLASLAAGATVEATEVFNPHAITKIWNKGIGGVMFLFLFVSIPIGLGVLKQLKVEEEQFEEKPKRNLLKNWLNYAGIILILIVDSFIAFKVAKNINEIEYLTNKTNHRISVQEALLTENFWLVFILGTLGVFLFSLIIDKLFEQLNKRNATLQVAKGKKMVDLKTSEIKGFNDEINNILQENTELDIQLNSLQKDLDNIREKIILAPANSNEKIKVLNQIFLTFKQRVQNLAQIYRSQVDNDKLPLSRAEMENRISLFMEGWSSYLYAQLSTIRAEQKTSNALTECEKWLTELKPQHSNADFEFIKN